MTPTPMTPEEEAREIVALAAPDEMTLVTARILVDAIAAALTAALTIDEGDVSEGMDAYLEAVAGNKKSPRDGMRGALAAFVARKLGK